MHDIGSGHQAGKAAPPLDVGSVLRQLPPAMPLRDGWPELARRLAAKQDASATGASVLAEPASARTHRRRPRARLLLALAASLLVAVLLTVVFPLLRAPAAPGHDSAAMVESPVMSDADALAVWMQESARLETQLTRQGSRLASSGDTAWLRSGLTDRIGEVDLLLAGSIDPLVQQSLWRERVLLLRQLGALEHTDQMLAARGERELPLRRDWL